jgi:hypothetical protein
VRTYLYELLDLRDNPRDAESNFGILRANGTPKPAFTAVKNMIAALADSGPSFTPGTLRLTLSSRDASVRHLLLEKRDGRFELLLWENTVAYDTRANRDVDQPVQRVVVGFEKPIKKATAYVPLQGPTAVREYPAGDKVEIDVPDHLLILEITPGTP